MQLRPPLQAAGPTAEQPPCSWGRRRRGVGRRRGFRALLRSRRVSGGGRGRNRRSRRSDGRGQGRSRRGRRGVQLIRPAGLHGLGRELGERLQQHLPHHGLRRRRRLAGARGRQVGACGGGRWGGMPFERPWWRCNTHGTAHMQQQDDHAVAARPERQASLNSLAAAAPLAALVKSEGAVPRLWGGGVAPHAAFTASVYACGQGEQASA